MRSRRKLADLQVGEGVACVFWMQASDGGQTERIVESRPIKVTERQVLIYLDDDGEEIVKLDRKRNKSARVYLNTTLEDVMEERVVNFLSNSTPCCYAGEREGAKKPCTTHTPEWIAEETQRRVNDVRGVGDVS